MNVLVILKIRRANRTRRQMVSQNRSNRQSSVDSATLPLRYGIGRVVTNENRSSATNNSTNLILAILVAGITVILLYQNTFENISVFNKREAAVIFMLTFVLAWFYENKLSIHLTNVFLLLSFPIDFFIYCGMSKQL